MTRVETPESSVDVKVVSEPATYRRDLEGVSYFRDLIFRDDDAAAMVRLERHGAEMDLERRVNPNRVQGQGGFFTPPTWLVAQFATLPRPKRVLAKLIAQAENAFPLSAGTAQINLPRLTSGTSEQPSGDAGVVSDTDIVDAALTSPVVTISGQEDVALQLLEQSPAGAYLDTMMFRDLLEAYDAQLEQMLLTGTGPNVQPTSQFLGLLNIPGTNTVTYTSAAPTATGLFTYLGQAEAQVGKNRKNPPEAWLMTTSRAAWLGSSEDAQSRPLMITDNASGNGMFNLLAFQVGIDDSIPTNLGPGANQDVIIVCRPSDMMLWESAPTLMTGLEVLSGTMQARIQLRAYAAFIERSPQGVTIVQGSGFVVQPGF